MGPSLMLNAQPESSSQPIATQPKLRTDMPHVRASGVPDQMSRHALPEGIVFVRHKNLGLVTDEELARAAENGTPLDLVSMEPQWYPWLTDKHTGVSARPAADSQDRQSLESHPNPHLIDIPSFHPQHDPQPNGSQGFGTRPKSLLHGRPNCNARVVPQQSTGVKPSSHPVAVPRLGVVSSPYGISWLGHQAAGGAGSVQPSTDTLQGLPKPPRQRSLTPPGPFPDPRLRAVTPQGPAPSPQLLPDPILVFNKGPRIKTTIRTSAAGPSAKPLVHVIGSRRAVPLPHSPGANSPSPRANLLYPEAASQLTQVPCSCVSPDATISDTSGSPTPSVDFEVLSRALGTVSTPVHSPSPVATDQLGITAQASQPSAAQLDCSESLEKQSPPPSSPTQALTDSAPYSAADSAADSALNRASEALPVGVLFQQPQLPRASFVADRRLQTLPGTLVRPTPEALQPALFHSQAQTRPLESLAACAAEALLSGSQAVKQQQSSRPPQPAALETRMGLVSSGPTQTVHEQGGPMQSVTSDDGNICQQADQQGAHPGLSASILTEASPEAAGECDEEWVPDNAAMLAASALAGMADSHLEEGSHSAEDVSLVEIRHRLQSLIAQLDNLPAVAMEQHRAEPGFSNMDIDADDCAPRRGCSFETADTHDDGGKLCVSGNMPAAAYKGSSSWAASSNSHQLHAGDQLGNPADTHVGPKAPSNGANHGLPTPPTRWIAIPIPHPINFAASSAFAAARAAPAVPRRISFGRSIPVPVGHSARAQASQQPALPSPAASSLQAGQQTAGREPQLHSDGLALRQMPSKRKATLQLPESSQQTAATGDTQHDEEEESDRAVKRSKHRLRKLNEHSAWSDAAPSSSQRVLTAVASVQGFRNRTRSQKQDKADTQAGLQKDHFDSLAAKLENIELETTIQQLQHELEAVRQQQASQVSSLEVQLEAAQSRAARAEAAQEHVVQQQFADDCLKTPTVLLCFINTFLLLRSPAPGLTGNLVTGRISASPVHRFYPRGPHTTLLQASHCPIRTSQDTFQMAPLGFQAVHNIYLLCKPAYFAAHDALIQREGLQHVLSVQS
ncbi:hypothetical protein WJX77_003410 [Trebouxia sp. C0004]